MAGATTPKELAHLPAALQRAIKEQCGGQWSRVTVERGVFTVHNRPQPNGLALRVAKPPKKKVMRPAPKPPTAPLIPPLAHMPAHALVEPIPMPVVTEPAPLREAPTTRRREPASPPVQPPRVLRPAAEVLWQAPTPAERPPEAEATWVLMPGIEQSSDWDGSDLADKAWRLAERIRTGLGDVAPLGFHDDVTALNGVNLEQVESVVRHAERVEVDASTAWKLYPILRFHRADNMVIVGFRDPMLPVIIAAYFTTLRDADATGRLSPRITGGGGRRKTGGLPNTPAKLISAIRLLGASIDDPTERDTVLTVTYEGCDLGKVPVERTTPKKDIENAWQRTRRRIEALREKRANGTAH